MKGALHKLRRSISGMEPEIDSKSSSSASLPHKKGLGLEKSKTMTAIDDSQNNYEDDDALPPVILAGYSDSTKNRLLTPEMCDEIRTLMPLRIQLYPQWNLLYSLEQHGASLHSLYDNIKPKSETSKRVGYVLVIKDRKNGIFGAYCNEPFQPNEHRRYSGNGECFLWKLEKVPRITFRGYTDSKEDKQEVEEEEEGEENWQFTAYPFTGVNEFAIYCTSKFISMGAGDGHYGLWCDDGLMHGVSNPTMTYGNDVLSREGRKFTIVGLEMWRVG